MNKSLRITNIVFSSLTLISIIFAALLFNLNQQESIPEWLQLTYGSLLGITGMGIYLGLLVIGSIMVHLFRVKKEQDRIILIDGILNIIFGISYVIGTAISHATGTWAEIFTIVMDCLSLSLIYLSIMIHQKKIYENTPKNYDEITN